MKAWSRAQYQQEREAGLYHHHRAEADLISSYLDQHHHHHHHHEEEPGHHHALPYGVPIPPPLVPDEDVVVVGHRGQGDEYPPPPPRTSSSNTTQSSRARGKRSRHAGTGQHQEGRSGNRGGGGQVEEVDSRGDIHYPKYELYNNGQYKYSTQPQQRECQYTTKYGEDCYFSSSKYPDQSGARDQAPSVAGNKTWPKQRLPDDSERVYTQDDQRVQYIQDQLEAETSRLLLRGEDNREQRYASSGKKRTKQQQQQQQQHYSSRDKSPCEYPSSSSAAHYRDREREYLVSTGDSKHYLQQV